MMKITPLARDIAPVWHRSQPAASGFAGILKQSLSQVVEQQVTAHDLTRQLAIGETDSIHTVMVAVEKATLSWQLLQQVRNKLTDAYQEISRMQL